MSPEGWAPLIRAALEPPVFRGAVLPVLTIGMLRPKKALVHALNHRHRAGVRG